MLIHRCIKCNKISINRIAGDDDPATILKVFEASQNLSKKLRNLLNAEGVGLLVKKDRQEIQGQLFGKN